MFAIRPRPSAGNECIIDCNRCGTHIRHAHEHAQLAEACQSKCTATATLFPLPAAERVATHTRHGARAARDAPGLQRGDRPVHHRRRTHLARNDRARGRELGSGRSAGFRSDPGLLQGPSEAVARRDGGFAGAAAGARPPVRSRVPDHPRTPTCPASLPCAPALP